MEAGAFFRIVGDPGVFDFGEFNLFKVFYVRYFFSRQLAQMSPAWKQEARPSLVRHGFARLLSLLQALGIVIRLRLAGRPRVLFYGATGRISFVEGVCYDLYNARIVGERGRERFIIIEDTADSADKRYRPDFRMNDFGLAIRLLGKLNRVLRGARLQRFAEKVVTTYPELGFSANEAAEIVATFYANYQVHRFLLSLLAPERALLICHYGREAFIAACKSRGLSVTELMHGSIVGVDTFYNYPASYGHLFDRALFPDKTAVYGEYWRRVVIGGHMFPPESVIVAGYYLKVPTRQREREAGKRTRILICAQPTVQPELLDYIVFLKATLDRTGWEIIIKPHPRENAVPYEALAEEGFVSVSNRTAYELLAECDIHISSYSSVLYEAILYGVCNYALYVDRYAQYCDEVIGSGVALPLRPNQLPVPCAVDVGQVRFYLDDYRPDTLFGS